MTRRNSRDVFCSVMTVRPWRSLSSTHNLHHQICNGILQTENRNTVLSSMRNGISRHGNNNVYVLPPFSITSNTQ